MASNETLHRPVRKRKASKRKARSAVTSAADACNVKGCDHNAPNKFDMLVPKVTPVNIPDGVRMINGFLKDSMRMDDPTYDADYMAKWIKRHSVIKGE